VPDPNSVPRNCRFPISCNRYTLQCMSEMTEVEGRWWFFSFCHFGSYRESTSSCLCVVRHS